MNKNKYFFTILYVISIFFFSNYAYSQLTGVKTIKSSGGNYATFTLAINALNSQGVGSGGVTFYVDAGYVSTEDCPVITATGSSSNPIKFERTGSGNNPVIKPTGTGGATDAGITISGGDYITFDGIDITIATGSAVEFGYYITNSSVSNGAQYNVIKNCKITLNRTNLTSKAIYQFAIANATDANSYNKYQYVTVENSYQGIYITGNATYPDSGTEISNCTIGSIGTANDTGNGTVTVSGIYNLNASGISIFNNEIRNLTITGNTQLYGVFLESLQGTSNNIFSNKIYSLTTTSTSTSSLIYAMRIEINAAMIANVYNNAIWGLQHAISTAQTTFVIRTISAGLSATSTGTVNFYYNSVRIDENQFPTSSCLYIGSYGNYNIKNNIFANFSTPGATSKRYCITITNGTVQFNAEYNDYYIASGTNNYVGMYGSNSNKTTIGDWQFSTSQDANSMNINPNYTSSTDLTPTAGNYLIGSVISGITTDITNASRSNPPDIGAYEGSEAGRWLGNQSADWLNINNWDNLAIPLSGDNVSINSWSVYQPHITSVPSNPAECNNLTINNGASITIDAGKALTVNGTLTNNAGNSGIILKSDASGTASLKDNTAGVNATVERFISDSLEYHMLGSPVSLQSFTTTLALSDSLYTWNNLTGNWVSYTDANFTTINSGNNFIPAKGYAINNSSIETLIFSGTLNQGNVSIPLSNAAGTYQGWNFISNPYPSAVNWNASSGWSRSMLEDAGSGERAIWIWNPVVGNYGTYISNAASGTNNVSNNISIGQGFWVKSASAGTLNMDNNVRVHSTQPYLKSTMVSDMLRIKVTTAANTYSDEVIVKFGNPTDVGGSEKMFSMNSSSPGLYFTKYNKNWSINLLNSIAQQSTVALSFKAGFNGNYTINASEMSSFNPSTYIYLKDVLKNTVTDLNQNSSYNFSATVNDNEHRFQLIFSSSPLDLNEFHINHCNIYCYNNFVYINSGENIKKIYLFNTMGQLIKSLENLSPGEFQLDMNNNKSGCYIIKVITDKNIFSEKIIVK